MPRIGYLAASTPDALIARRAKEAFRQALRDLRYIEGENITIEYRFADGAINRLPELAAELARLGVDLIVAAPSSAALAARSATNSIPIIMINVGDPVGLGLIESLARPGGNVTGLSFSVGMETFAKGLELLRDAVPGLQRVAVLINASNQASVLVRRELEANTVALSLRLQFVEVGRAEQLEAAFDATLSGGAQAFFVITDSLFVVNAARVGQFAIKHHLPSMHGFKEVLEPGGLMSYGPDAVSQWTRAAAFVDKILRGAKPVDLPVEQPTKFELVINLKTAKALGLTIPPTLLARADEVIE
jgi:putative ABC transport system substrate-binding protein